MMSDQNNSPRQLPLFAEVAPAKMLVLPEIARDWMESEAGYFSSSRDFLANLNRVGLSSKTCLTYSIPTGGVISPQSSFRWLTSGIAAPIGCLTLNISAFPNVAQGCSLSAILEEDIPQMYFLSQRAIAGMLRRAANRQTPFHPQLEAVLMGQAEAFFQMEP